MQLKTLRALAFVALTSAPMCAVAATTSIDLSRYQVTGNFALDILGGMGLEASAVAYARDRNGTGSLFFVGDEGLGVVEVTRTGVTLGSMTFSGWPSASTNHDAEGLTYRGGGVLIVAEERLQDAFSFNYLAGGSVNLAAAPFVSIGGDAGNNGTEGISYDARNGGSFVSVKQNSPQQVLGGTLTFAPAGGTSMMASLFDPALLGLSSLSDVQTLSPVDALVGQPAADNLLILSLGSRMLLEVTRTGSVLSSFDLSGVTQEIEGVTIDQNGVIYLVAEAGALNSRLIELTPTAAIPEPQTYALMLAGLGVIGVLVRRRKQRQTGLT